MSIPVKEVNNNGYSNSYNTLYNTFLNKIVNDNEHVTTYSNEHAVQQQQEYQQHLQQKGSSNNNQRNRHTSLAILSKNEQYRESRFASETVCSPLLALVQRRMRLKPGGKPVLRCSEFITR